MISKIVPPTIDWYLRIFPVAAAATIRGFDMLSIIATINEILRKFEVYSGTSFSQIFKINGVNSSIGKDNIYNMKKEKRALRMINLCISDNWFMA